MLTATNLTVLMNWRTNRSGTFDEVGRVTLTDAILAVEPHRYFTVRAP